MDDTDRVIGALQANQEHTDRRIDVLEKKIDTLLEFKWKAAGVMAFIMASAEVVSIYLKFKP